MKMKSIINFLIGKKTYIAAVLAAGLNLAIISGWLGELTSEQIIAIEGIIAAVLGTTIRLAIQKK